MEAGRPVVLGPPGGAGKPVVLGPPGSSGSSSSPPKPSIASPPNKRTPEPSTAQRSSFPCAPKNGSAESQGADKSAANASKASAVPSSSPAGAKPASSATAPAPKQVPTSPTPAPAPKEAPKEAPATKEAPASPTSAPAPTEVPKDAGSQDSASKEATTLAPLPEGTYVRICGLVGAAHLNGQLGQVLRLGDTPDRTIVRTGAGEKALKRANLSTGSVVYPKHAFTALGTLLVLTVVAVGDVCRTWGRNSVSAAALPILAASWVFVTLWLCMVMWWPCRPPSSWFPSVSELGANAPVRNVYRTGFVVFALLFAITNGLYKEILLNDIEIPAPLEADGLFAQWQLDLVARAAAAEEANLAALQAPTPGPLLVNPSMVENGTEDAATTGNGTDDAAIAAKSSSWWSQGSWMSWLPFAQPDTDEDMAAAEADSADSDAGAASSSWLPSFWWPLNLLWPSSASPSAAGANAVVDAFNITAANASGPKRNFTNEMLITGADRSLEWGYATAAGIGIQAVFSFNGKVNWRGVVHSLGMLLFAVSIFQHSTQSNFWVTLPWGKSPVGAPGWLGTALRFRRNISEYAPLALMMGPLSSQFLATSQKASYTRDRQASNSMTSIFKDTGMPKAIALVLWALVLLTAVFYGTFAFDFWCAADHPRGETLSNN